MTPDERKALLAIALDAAFAAIVIGSRGLNVVKSQLFGSVAYKVMPLSPLPVNVVP